MIHVTCRLTAKNWDQLRNPTLDNRVWATFTFFTLYSGSSFICFGMDKAGVFKFSKLLHTYIHTYIHPFNGPLPGLPGSAGTRKVKPIWVLLKQETVSGSDISWAICKSAPRSRQITTQAPHHSVFTGRMPFLPPNQQRQSTEGT